eukprot:TRINITY_DN6407_c0_g1_i1.p1 TRINITY_DN6407_c0_g1~~TRINITY_DN6407_c0_g1_i1.p1  ORF type:complete len:477 (+),score=96.23 TRINITY_DN6407_c0_g1_i1:88-1518(+)
MAAHAPKWPKGPIPPKPRMSYSHMTQSMLSRPAAASMPPRIPATSKAVVDDVFSGDEVLAVLDAWQKEVATAVTSAAPSSASASAPSKPRGGAAPVQQRLAAAGSRPAVPHAAAAGGLRASPAAASTTGGASASSAAGLVAPKTTPSAKALVTPAQKRPRPLSDMATPPKRLKTGLLPALGKAAAVKADAAAKTAKTAKQHRAEAAAPKLMKRKAAASAVVQAEKASPAEKAAKPPSRLVRLLARSRQNCLATVPVPAFRRLEKVSSSSSSPRPTGLRCRMRPLESWRNERQVFERTPKSPTPSMTSIILNCAPKLDGELTSSQCRELVSLLPVPPSQLEDAPVQGLGLGNSRLQSSIFTLQPVRPNEALVTVPLSRTEQSSANCGFLHVLYGAVNVRWTHGEEGEEAVLQAGDSCWYRLDAASTLGPLLASSTVPKLPSSLVAAAEVQRDAKNHGARILWAITTPAGKKASAAAA